MVIIINHIICAQATKRAGEKRAHAKARAEKGATPGRELLEQQEAANPLWVYEPMGQLVSCVCMCVCQYVCVCNSSSITLRALNVLCVPFAATVCACRGIKL